MNSSSAYHVSSHPIRIASRSVICVLLIFLPWLCTALPVQNGTFDVDLAGWTTQGDVQQADSHAVLGDQGAEYSLLYQAIGVTPGSYRIEFDFRGLLAEAPGGFPDTLYASLYFIDNLPSFDLGATPPVFDDQLALMDLDASGPLNVVGTLQPSNLGPDWTHFSSNFTSAYAWVIPAFEFLNLDEIQANGQIFIDNVEISQSAAVIPEPASIALIGIGLAALATRRRRNAKQSRL